MEFCFKNEITAMDIWKLTMYRIYHSMSGVCNIIFSIALIIVTVRLWNPAEKFMMSLLVLACVLYPVIQPLSIYIRAIKQVAALPEDMILEINDKGIHVTGNGEKAHLPWSRVRGVIKEKNMIVLVAEAGRGYMLTYKTLGKQKDELVNFVESKIKHKA